MSACPIMTGPNVTGMVDNGLNFIKELALEYKALAISLINVEKSINPNPISFAVTYDVPADLLKAFVAPTRPTVPDMRIDKSLLPDPGNVPEVHVEEASFDPLPQFAGTMRPAITKYVPPALTATTPELTATQTDVDEPTLAPIDNPEEPELFAITIPEMPQFADIPEFQGIAPIVDFAAPEASLTFVAREYASTLLTDIRSRLTSAIGGQVGLPVAIEQALFARARDREDLLKRQAIAEAHEDVANSGHSLPPGSLMAHIEATRQTAQRNASQANREITIELAKSDREMLARYVEIGISLEGQLINADLRLQELGLRANEVLLRATIDVFNANVSLFNARAQLYGIESQVFRDRIAAENLLIERVRAEIEAQRLIGEVNKDLIALLDARIRVRTQLIDQYRARWEAIKVIAERDGQRIEQDRLKVQVFDTVVGAWSKQWDVTIKQYEADAANGRLFESQANAYAAQVNAVSTGNRNKIDQKRLSLDVQLANITAWKAKLDKFDAELRTAVEQIKAETSTFDGQARIYSADGEIARSQTEANTRAVQVLLDGLRAKADILLKNVELQINQLVQLSGLQVEGIRGAAQNSTQLSAGATAALNFSASAHESNNISNEVSCRTELTGSLDE